MSVSDSCQVERYEQLRSQALGRWTGSASRLGLTLFLRQGMPAWLAAWSHYGSPDRAETARPRHHQNVDTLLPPAGQNEVAMVLAGMALHHQRQIHS